MKKKGTEWIGPLFWVHRIIFKDVLSAAVRAELVEVPLSDRYKLSFVRLRTNGLRA
jgi:hypothetical protein